MYLFVVLTMLCWREPSVLLMKTRSHQSYLSYDLSILKILAPICIYQIPMSLKSTGDYFPLLLMVKVKPKIMCGLYTKRCMYVPFDVLFWCHRTQVKHVAMIQPITLSA